MYEKTMERDPAGLFAWIVNELGAAEAAGERVWLMGDY
jgi:sphingomyelin phosphodiesterase